jgi:hypothetical protein
LHVIDGDKYRAGFGEGPKGREARQRYSPLIGSQKRRVRQQEGSLEGLCAADPEVLR